MIHIKVCTIVVIFQSLIISCTSSDVSGQADGGIEVLPGSSVLLVFDNEGRLGDLKNSIEMVIRETIPDINRHLSIDNIKIRVVASPSKVIPEIGIGGYNPSSNEIFLYIDPEFPAIANSIAKELGPNLAHEVHHAMRRRTVGYGNTLLQAIVSEGLADHFSMEVSDIDPPIWATALTESQLDQWIATASATWSNSNYDHDAWFFGTTGEIPRWTGYSIGFKLVGDYLAANPDARPSTLISEPASSFVP